MRPLVFIMTDSEILALPFDIERHKQSQYLLSEFVIAPGCRRYLSARILCQLFGVAN